MYGNSIPAGSVGGDLFEYLNFQQRYNIDARIALADKLSKQYLEPLPKGATPRNAVDEHVQWLQSKAGYSPADAAAYRKAKSSEQLRVAENLQELYTTAGVLLVDAQGHGIIGAKIASTVHDTFHAFMLSELDRYGKTDPRSVREAQPTPGAVGHGPQRLGLERRAARGRLPPCSMARYGPADISAS